MLNENGFKIPKFFFFPLLYLLYIYSKYKKNLNCIHISMSLTNNYTYPIMVSITSILINSNKTTFIYFHILIGDDVENNNKKKIHSLKRINTNCFFNFYNVGNNFKGFIHGRNRTIAGFYRIILGKLIPNINKIIYLDGDTIIYKDLSEMYNLNMSNVYFRGVAETTWSHRIYKKNYICDGVMLMNLDLIRKNNVYDKFVKYYWENYKKGKIYGDQFIINDLFNNKIGFLPPKFGIWFINKRIIEKYQKLSKIIYTKKELIESNQKPVIRHIWGWNEKGDNFYRKPWLSVQNYTIKEEWNYYAKKTGYYKSICLFFKFACIFN